MTDQKQARWLWWAQAAVLVAAGGFVFSPALHGGWLWDDFEIRENPLLRNGAGLMRIWFAPVGPDYYPLESTVRWLQWHLWHQDLFGYHLTNLGLHLLSAFLIWHLLRKLGVRFAWLGGLLFVVHPVATESVAWVAELKNTLSLPLLLVAFIFWIAGFDSAQSAGSKTVRRSSRSANEGGRRYYLASLLFFLAAMLSKSSVVMLPFVLLLYAWWRRGRVGWADARAAAPFFGVSLALGLATVWFQHHRAIASWRLPHAALVSSYNESFLARVAEAGQALQFYFLKAVFPWEVMPIYPGWTTSLDSPAAFFPWLLLVAAVVLLWRKRSGYGRHALFGLGWFGLNLAPVLGFIPMAYHHVAPVADHLAYLPLVGLIGLAVAIGNRKIGKSGSRKTLVAGWVIVSAVVAALAVESRGYAGVFVDQETMWAYNLRHNSRSAAVYVNLGFIQHRDGQLTEALENYRKAIRIDPNDPQAEDELAGILVDQNRMREAIPHYERALQLRPDFVNSQNNLGAALLSLGRLPEAIDHFEQAVRLNPNFYQARLNLAHALQSAGRTPEALDQFAEALRLDPDDAEAVNYFGITLAEANRLPEAASEFQQAIRLNSNYIDAHENLGRILQALGQKEEGEAQLAEAARLRKLLQPQD